MLPLIVPRPLLVINGDSDVRTPGTGVLECADAAGRVYRRYGAEEKFVLHLQTGQKVTPAALQLAISGLRSGSSRLPNKSKTHSRSGIIDRAARRDGVDGLCGSRPWHRPDANGDGLCSLEDRIRCRM
jgi:hypothetical protein